MSRASDTAYTVIRDHILSGTLAPGSQLTEEELAERCGVSRTPIRDALRRLEAEMLVRRSDTQRSFVPDWSDEEVEEIFTLRGLIESHAAVRAARLITTEQIARLKHHNALIHAAIDAQPQLDVEAFVANNRAFHTIVLEAAKSQRLLKMRGLLVEQAILHRTARRYDRIGLHRSHADHVELVLAFEARDPEWARALMSTHIRRALHVTLQDQAGSQG